MDKEEQHKKDVFILRLLIALWLILAIVSFFLGQEVESRRHTGEAAVEFLDEQCGEGYYVGCIEGATEGIKNITMPQTIK